MEKTKLPYNIDSDYSESFIEFFRKQPRWLLRFGLIIVLSVFSLIVFLGFMISYPDKLVSKVTIESQNPPVFVKSKINGVVDSLLVLNNEKIEFGESVCVLRSNVSYNDYLYLKEVLNTKVYDSLLTKDLALGDMQEAFNKFVLDLRALKINQLLKKTDVEIGNLENSIDEEKVLMSKRNAKLELLKEELELERSKFERYKSLYEKGVISKLKYENYEIEFLNKKRLFEDTKVSLSNSKIEILNINRAIDKTQIENAEYDLIQQAAIENSKILLLEKIKQWEETYLLKSPINGVVNFHNFLITENKNVLDGEDIFSIVPDEFGQLFGVLFIPFNKSGKVEIGQNVNIYLDNFPSTEYGILKGKVSNISKIQSNDGYLAKIDLPNNLVTSFNTKIEFKSSLIGRAEIITEDMSILERIFNKFRDVFVN